MASDLRNWTLGLDYSWNCVTSTMRSSISFGLRLFEAAWSCVNEVRMLKLSSWTSNM